MGKLESLKEWLTIPEAAAQLSEYFNEKVSTEDLFRFVLSKHLKLAVSFLKEMPAHRKDIQPNIDLDEVVWLKCGEWDMPMIESNISYVRQLIADLPMFEIPSATLPLVVEDNTGEQYCLLGENFPFEAPLGYSMPKGNIFVVRTKELNAFINSTWSTGLPTSTVNTVNLDDLPKGHIDNSSKLQKKEEVEPYTTKERKSISIIIMSLAAIADIDTEQSSKTANVIQNQAERLGLSISPNTISKYLSEARKVLHPE